MKNRDFAVWMNKEGELLQDNMHEFTREKYKADSPFFWGPIPFVIMIACIVIDIAFFRTLFLKISYDEPRMIILEVAGLAFAADVVAAYAGILGKRISQGLSKDKMNFYLLLGVPIIALIVNGILRVTTISLMTADGSINAASISLTIIAIVTPMFTSIGNFAISFQTYDPLKRKMRCEEIALDEIKDFCRRLNAIKQECDTFNSERCKDMDKKHLENAKKTLINDAFIRCADLEIMLMIHQGNPTETNILSQSRRNEIFDRIKKELKGLEAAIGVDGKPSSVEEKSVARVSEAA